MKQRAFTIRTMEYDHVEELAPQQASLVKEALDAAGRAYAPYSNYMVGAAALLDNGRIVTGNNQENAAYPSGLCAERVALFYAGARYPDAAVISLAIVALKQGKVQEGPVAPCGGCRQVLVEKEAQGKKDMEVILYGEKKIQVLRSAADLLPLPFVFPSS